jgi:hypothetical protein
VEVCADIGRPSHPQKAAERGWNAYLVSMFVICDRDDSRDRREIDTLRSGVLGVCLGASTLEGGKKWDVQSPSYPGVAETSVLCRRFQREFNGSSTRASHLRFVPHVGLKDDEALS